MYEEVLMRMVRKKKKKKKILYLHYTAKNTSERCQEKETICVGGITLLSFDTWCTRMKSNILTLLYVKPCEFEFCV